jgi:hypothetical protein
MNTVRTVFFKEIIDNFRDRRTLATALLMGPLFGPILFAFVINLSVKQSLSSGDEALDLPVIGREHAPNLIAYLQSNNIWPGLCRAGAGNGRGDNGPGKHPGGTRNPPRTPRAAGV